MIPGENAESSLLCRMSPPSRCNVEEKARKYPKVTFDVESDLTFSVFQLRYILRLVKIKIKDNINYQQQNLCTVQCLRNRKMHASLHTWCKPESFESLCEPEPQARVYIISTFEFSPTSSSVCITLCEYKAAISYFFYKVKATKCYQLNVNMVWWCDI